MDYAQAPCDRYTSLLRKLVADLRGLHFEWEFPIPIFPWESRGNPIGMGVDMV